GSVVEWVVLVSRRCGGPFSSVNFFDGHRQSSRANEDGVSNSVCYEPGSIVHSFGPTAFLAPSARTKTTRLGPITTCQAPCCRRWTGGRGGTRTRGPLLAKRKNPFQSPRW